MQIEFASKKLAKECNDFQLLRRRYGDRRAKVLRRRLDEIDAARTMAQLATLPAGRYHELVGNRKRQISADLDHPYRLIFKPADPVPLRADGGLDWEAVTVVVILEIADTHE